jgi:hypothetical protein
MTTTSGRCTACGLTSVVAELRVYMQAPGAVARCPGCEGVLMVIVTGAGRRHVKLAHFHLADT